MAWDPISRTVPQFEDSNGEPYSGAVLKFYAAGTTTNISAATDSSGGTTVSSIALNASGYPEVSGNVVIPHLDQSFKIALYPTQAAADSDSGAIWTIDAIGIGAPTQEWQDSGVTPVFASTTTFTLSDDQTANFHIGRRLKLVDSGGTDHATITNSVYSSPNTTVTVSVDSGGVLDSGLSSVQLSILSADDSSVPFMSFSSDTITVAGDLAMGQTFIQKVGADVASAAALPVNVVGNIFDVTGTTTITSLASKGIGTEVTLQFDGALTLTHHATDLVLPAGENITTAAGDVAVFYEYATGDWRCISYQRQQPVVVTIIAYNRSMSGQGTSSDFTGVPEWASEINITFDGLSISGTDDIELQLGDSTGILTSGYEGSYASSATTRGTHSSAFTLAESSATADLHYGTIRLNPRS